MKISFKKVENVYNNCSELCVMIHWVEYEVKG